MFILVLYPWFYFVFEECGHACHGKGVEVKGHLAGVCSLFPLLGFQGLNSERSTFRTVLLCNTYYATEP